jgi:hypothetical protein
MKTAEARFYMNIQLISFKILLIQIKNEANNINVIQRIFDNPTFLDGNGFVLNKVKMSRKFSKDAVIIITKQLKLNAPTLQSSSHQNVIQVRYYETFKNDLHFVPYFKLR